MISLRFEFGTTPKILCLGAHSDDIEIGAGATILDLASRYPKATVRWVVFAAGGTRAAEAEESAKFFLQGFDNVEIDTHEFRDGYLTASLTELKERFESFKDYRPDMIFTHNREDRHQDHALVSDLTWQTFRDHLVLEYEIPKYDGDLGSPNFFCPVSVSTRDKKLDALERFFGSQRNKQWFSRDTFSSLMRLRGIECNSDSGFAEAFYCRKMAI